MKLTDLSVPELISVRQWLVTVSNEGSAAHSRRVHDRILDVDMLLWNRILGGESPWDGAKRFATAHFVDDNFKETIKSFRKEKKEDAYGE